MACYIVVNKTFDGKDLSSKRLSTFQCLAMYASTFPLLWAICQGSARRKKKVVHRTATADDKKLQSSLKKLAVNNIAGIEEVRERIYHNANLAHDFVTSIMDSLNNYFMI